MVYNGYYKVMSNIPKMGHLPTPGIWGVKNTDWWSTGRIWQEDTDRPVEQGSCGSCGSCGSGRFHQLPPRSLVLRGKTATAKQEYPASNWNLHQLWNISRRTGQGVDFFHNSSNMSYNSYRLWEVCRFWVQSPPGIPTWHHGTAIPSTTLKIVPSHRAHARMSRPTHDTAAPGDRKLEAGAWALQWFPIITIITLW